MSIPVSIVAQVTFCSRNACLVVVIEINPAAHPINRLPPFRRKSHDNGPALFIVFLQAKLHNGIPTREPQLLVNLVLDRQAVCVPAESPLHMIALHGPIPRYDVFDCRCE